MNKQSVKSSYTLGIEKLGKRIRGYHKGLLLFDSSNALKMHETHHEPVYYIPRRDVNMALLVQSEFRTFCPFKGNATHWSLNLETGVVENIAWSYENPIEDAKDIIEHLAFYDTALDQLYIDDQKIALNEDDKSPEKDFSLTEWLAQGRWKNESSTELTRHLAHRLRDMGFPLMRLNVAIRQLHPLLAGESYVWRKSDDQVTTRQMSHDSVNTPVYQDSPLKLVSEGLGGIRQKLRKDQTQFDFPIMKELQAEGATDYVAFPLVFSDGHIHNMTLTSDDPFGFTTEHLGQMYEALPIIARLYEVHKLNSNTRALMETYLGKSAGEQVLSGLTKRGDGGKIEAAILHCDLVNSTGLTVSLGQEKYLELLNHFFDAIAQAVYAHGGDILKFIGDAVLAIFPTDESTKTGCEAACKNAAMAIHDIYANLAKSEFSDNLQCKTGAHFGEVMYGNIGSEQRLDFTVIGSAANEVARIADLCSDIAEPVLMSQEFTEPLDCPHNSVGHFKLKGVAKERELFSYTPKEL